MMTFDVTDPTLSWRSIEEQVIPEPQNQWVADPGSLTELLIRHSEKRFRVNVLSEAWQSLSCDVFSGVESDYWSRKVQLVGKGEVWVAAHTLIPKASISGVLEEVVMLGTKPLGGFLFEQPNLTRTRFECCEWAQGSWGRRSLFKLDEQEVLVAEFFLPALFN